MEKAGRNRSNRALASAYLAITPIKGLTWKTQVAYDYTGSSSNDVSGAITRYNIVGGKYINVTQGTSAYVNPGNNNAMSFSVSNSDGQTLDIQNTLTYNWSSVMRFHAGMASMLLQVHVTSGAPRTVMSA